MKLWKKVRTAVVTIAFTGAMVLGAMRATASADSSAPRMMPEEIHTPAAPGATGAPDGASCTTWACNTECAPFGGDLVSGGPGKPLQCACCG